jgi:hypothetical protein
MGFKFQTFLLMRSMVCNSILIIHGYLIPTFNTIKIIQIKDRNGIREYLTFWAVFMMFLYFEVFLKLFFPLHKFPPELKVAFVLWMTSPYFQGAVL